MDTRDKIYERINHWLDYDRQFWEYIAEKVQKETQSPIEALVYLELIRWSSPYSCEHCGYPIVTPQAQVGKYRADFLVEWKGKKVVIECDGHDFHEKTKKQAAHDKKRDRDISLLGYQIRRYTGSEIYQNARQVINDIDLIFDDELREFVLKLESKE